MASFFCCADTRMHGRYICQVFHGGSGCEYISSTLAQYPDDERMSSQLVERQAAIPSTLTTDAEGGARDPNLRLDRHTTQLFLCTDNGEVTTFASSPTVTTSSGTRSGALEVTCLVVGKPGGSGSTLVNATAMQYNQYRLPRVCCHTRLQWSRRPQGSRHHHIPCSLFFLIFLFISQ